jgi:hypothetical protein
LNFRKKASLKITTNIIPHDYKKGLNSFIHPVNKLKISITNKSSIPCTIREILFVYLEKDEQTKQVYDSISFAKRESVAKKTLMKSEEVSFILSYVDADEKKVLDNLEEIRIVSTYGQEYILKSKKLLPVIEEIKKLPPPDPDNLVLNHEK